MKKNPKNLIPLVGLNATQRKAIGAMNYKPRELLEGEAGARCVYVMQQPVYKPARDQGARLGIAR